MQNGSLTQERLNGNVPAVSHPVKPLRIVHLVSSLLIGGMEKFAIRLATQQKERGHDVTLIALNGGPLENEARSSGITVATLDGEKKFKRIQRTIRLFKNARPDVINAHNPSSLDYALLGKAISDAKIVLIRHGQGDKPVNALKWRFVNAVIAVSEAASDAMRSYQTGDLKKIKVIRNGFEPSGTNRNRNETRKALSLEGFVGIVVARLDPLKGHSILLDAMSQLNDENLRPRLLIVGDGPERASLEERATEKGLDHVSFLGFREDVSDLLDASDFFALPSLTEGLPLSLLEAMGHHLPVIATSVGGSPEVIRNDEEGILVPAGDALALSIAMKRLLLQPELRQSLASEGYRRVCQDFSLRQMVNQYDELYASIL